MTIVGIIIPAIHFAFDPHDGYVRVAFALLNFARLYKQS